MKIVLNIGRISLYSIVDMVHFIAQAVLARAMFFIVVGRFAEYLFGLVSWTLGDHQFMGVPGFLSHVEVFRMWAANYKIRRVAFMSNPPDEFRYMEQGAI